MSIFKKIFKSNKDRNHDSSSSLENLDEIIKSQVLIKEYEFRHQSEKFRLRANADRKVTLGQLLKITFDVKKEEIDRMRLISDDEMEIIESKDEIWDFDLFMPFTQVTEDGIKIQDQDVNIIVDYLTTKNFNDKPRPLLIKNRTIMINLRIVGGANGETAYLQASLLLPPTRFGRVMYEKKSLFSEEKTVLIAYDFRSEKAIEEEFNAALEGLKIKLNNNQELELSILEREILDSVNINIAKNIYLGKKAFKEERFLDVIFYLEPVYKYIEEFRWENKLNEKLSDAQMEAAYLIGFAHFELGNFEKAYLFAERAANAKRSGVAYKMEFLNLLIAMKDIRSLVVLEDYFSIFENLKYEELSEELKFFYNFLIRRRIYVLIELKLYDQAKEMLNDLLASDPDNKFALEELEYIKMLERK